jgi:hypothetical protein
MNPITYQKLIELATKEDEDGNTDHFEVGDNRGAIILLHFKRLISSDILYQLMDIVHIDGIQHQPLQYLMVEVEEKWKDDRI